jgi:hypothetical protein
MTDEPAMAGPIDKASVAARTTVLMFSILILYYCDIGDYKDKSAVISKLVTELFNRAAPHFGVCMSLKIQDISVGFCPICPNGSLQVKRYLRSHSMNPERRCILTKKVSMANI